MKKANIILVNDFLKKNSPEKYDFKLENQCLKDIDNSLERELLFKKKTTRVPDPDCCELTMSIMCLLLEMQGMQVEGYEGRHIYLKDDIVLETDTANSFISIYKGALMEYNTKYKSLCEKYEITGSFMNEYEKIYSHRDEFTLEGYNDELLAKFEEFASLTHSLGNFIIGPKGFNTADSKSKASKYKRDWSKFDRMDLFLKRVAEDDTYESWKKWFAENCFTTYINYFYKYTSCFEGCKTADLSKSVLLNLEADNFVNKMTLINTIILNRGKAMVYDLQQYFREKSESFE